MRRSARGQSLPENEVEILNQLHGYALSARAKMLYETGWTLRAIGEAFDPPRARSTVRYWILVDIPDIERQATPSLPTAVVPTLSTSEPAAKDPRRALTAAESKRIAFLAPKARRYRATMHPNHTYARSNRELTDMCKRLHHEERVTIGDLAKAASVSYRAMARRVS